MSDIHRAREQIRAASADVGDVRNEEHDGGRRSVFFVVAPDGLCFCFFEPIAE